MLKIFRKRFHWPAALSLLYFTSIFLLSIFPQKSLETLFFGLFLASFGSLVSWVGLRSWEKERKLRPVSFPLPIEKKSDPNEYSNTEDLNQALTDSQSRTQELIAQLNQKGETILKFEQEKAQFDHKIEDLHHQINALKESSEEELRRKTTLLSEYQETINQQREVIKKKQDQISELESKIRDLNYEVKTLLQLAEMSQIKTEENRGIAEPDPGEEPIVPLTNQLVKNQDEASLLLKRCVDIAQKITGAGPFGNGTSRFQNIPLNNYALDLRRLFDNLRSETSSPVLVYSLKENRILFANNQTRNLLGWSVEKFIQNFPEIIQEGSEEWKKALGHLSTLLESRARLLLKTKNGQNLLVHCQIRSIPTGIFRNHAIGVMYPA